ncbi:MAG: UDP-glucose--hexose-1-phosphate uridylyltransferase [Solobacterium sp.]|nr:UDP-glucose--hexose-1-phosphate uridylyltransferase [Solobacterium sp.]
MKKDMIGSLVQYGLNRELIQPADAVYVRNRLLEVMQEEDYQEGQPEQLPLHEILASLVQTAMARGIVADSITAQDLFDTKLMGCLTPWPSQVQERFRRIREEEGPEAATSRYYAFSMDTNYIRRDRMAKDIRWQTKTDYGDLDITINLAKPEKDPAAIAAAKNAVQTGYPKCQLCVENEGYAGGMNQPARENHRIIPLQLLGDTWYLQYSPYVYYNEHCIVFNKNHVPMKIDDSVFHRLLDFVRQFPHYFIGSNADLPIVGGSILSHEHFQGGRHAFAMAAAPLEREWTFRGFEDVKAGIVRWPMSVIRLVSEDPDRIAGLAGRILAAWRSYSDEACMIFAQTDGVRHNTITPICRRRGACYEMDLALRCNLTTDEYPLGVFHPHSDLHHIKKENIGLIEVMGLAILPGRLKTELDHLAEALVQKLPLQEYGEDIRRHGEWASRIAAEYTITEQNVHEILRNETGKVFLRVLEDAGVYKHDKEGREGFIRFLMSLQEEQK